MQREGERLDARRESGEHPKEGGQTGRPEGGGDYATLAAPAIDTTVRLHRRGQTDLRYFRTVRFARVRANRYAARSLKFLSI